MVYRPVVSKWTRRQRRVLLLEGSDAIMWPWDITEIWTHGRTHGQSRAKHTPSGAYFVVGGTGLKIYSALLHIERPWVHCNISNGRDVSQTMLKASENKNVFSCRLKAASIKEGSSFCRAIPWRPQQWKREKKLTPNVQLSSFNIVGEISPSWSSWFMAVIVESRFCLGVIYLSVC